MIPIPTLSFCITCKNRFYQISQTLRKNLDDNRLHQEWIEFVLVDFGSTDGLKNWVPDNFKDDLLSGYLKYYYTEELPFWHASIAKNTAHRLATHEILVNLDCDNYTGYHGGQFVIRQFLKNRNIIHHQFGGDVYDGSYGRISVLKKYFDRIGGYDESFGPMGYQDADLVERLKQAGLKYQLENDERFCQAIVNTKEEGLLNANVSVDFISVHNLNRQKSVQNIENGRLIANAGHYGINGAIYDHNGESVNRETERYPVRLHDGKTGKVAVLQELVRKIAQLSGFSSHPGLFPGKTGLSILLFEASRYFQLPELEQTAGALLDDVVEESGRIISLDFGNGLAGIAWGINYLMKNGFVENDAGFFDEIDSLLFEEDPFCKVNKGEYSLIGLYIEARLSGSAEGDLWTERTHVYCRNMANLLNSQEKLFIRTPEMLTPFLYCLCCWKERGVIKEVAKEVIPAAQELLSSTTRESIKTMPLQYYLHCLTGQKTIIQYSNNLVLADMNKLFFYKLLFPNCPLPSACLLENNFSRILSADGLFDELQLLNPQNIGIASPISGFAWSLLQHVQCQPVPEY